MIKLKYVRRKYQEPLISFEVQVEHEVLVPQLNSRIHYKERIYVVSDVIHYISEDGKRADAITVMLDDWD